MDNEPLPQDIPRDQLDDGYRLVIGAAPKLDFSRFCTPEDNERKRITRARAAETGAAEFLAKCPDHGNPTLFDTATAACLTCVATRTDLPLAFRYKVGGGTCYADTCPDHGSFVLKFGEMGCPLCRRPEIVPRVMAQRAGQIRYPDTCAAHGEAPFSTRSGKCELCFTTVGKERRPGDMGRPIQGENPRAVARRQGDSVYQDRCDVHGMTGHGVARGKCLTCFSSTGQPRRRLPNGLLTNYS